MALTAKQVQYMRPDPKRRLEVPAGPPAGLYLVVHPTGRKAWALRYRWRGRPKKLTFEKTYPDLKLAQARAEAEAALKDLERGVDPAAAAKEESTPSDTVGNVVSEFVKRYLKPRNRSWQETERILLKETKRWVHPDDRLADLLLF